MEIRTVPEVEADEVSRVFQGYGFTAEASAPVIEALQKNPEAWIDFMMRFELGLEKPEPKRALTSALTIAGAYVGGGIIPLAPYIVSARAYTALFISVILTLVALTVFGYIKVRFTGTVPARSAFQTALVGGLAAAAAFVIARLIS
jgi:vacuolar iron transporter family protein